MKNAYSNKWQPTFARLGGLVCCPMIRLIGVYRETLDFCRAKQNESRAGSEGFNLWGKRLTFN
jgi:hypothetical protein